MTRYPDKLHLSDYGCFNDVRVFRVDAPFRVTNRNTIPEGFLTDGASIPQAFWNIFSSTGKAFYPGVSHDFDYSPLSPCVDRLDADRELLAGLEEVGMGWTKRHLIYRAVRMFGGRFWKTKKRHECYDPNPD